MSRSFKISFFVTLSLVLCIFFPVHTRAASLYLSPANSSVNAGNIFTVTVFVNTQGQSINTSDAIIQFPNDLLQVVSVSKSSSIFSLWVEDPNFSNTVGQISFNGGIPNPGYTGGGGQLVSITFQAKKTGTASVIFSDSSVRANDGLGTDVLTSKAGATYTIVSAPVQTPPVVKPLPAPQKQVVPEVKKEPEPIPVPVVVTLKKPEISMGVKYDAPAIIGTSGYTDAQVTLMFISHDGTTVYVTDATLSDGSFALAVPHILKHDTYTVVALVAKEKGGEQDASNKISVNTGSFFSDVPIEIWWIISLLSVTIIGLVVYIFTHKYKHTTHSSHLKHDIKDAENVLHKSFDILREDVTDHIHEKMHTVADRKNAAVLEKEIDDAEDAINEKIKDIEKE